MQSHDWGSHIGPAKALKPPERGDGEMEMRERDTWASESERAISVPSIRVAFPVRLHPVSWAWTSERLSLEAVESVPVCVSWGRGGSRIPVSHTQTIVHSGTEQTRQPLINKYKLTYREKERSPRGLRHEH